MNERYRKPKRGVRFGTGAASPAGGEEPDSGSEGRGPVGNVADHETEEADQVCRQLS
jgi:hypothetical protein